RARAPSRVRRPPRLPQGPGLVLRGPASGPIAVAIAIAIAAVLGSAFYLVEEQADVAARFDPAERLLERRFRGFFRLDDHDDLAHAQSEHACLAGGEQWRGVGDDDAIAVALRHFLEQQGHRLARPG